MRQTQVIGKRVVTGGGTPVLCPFEPVAGKVTVN